MTYLQLVNAVLTKMRERNVGTYNENAYSALIAELINEAKEDVESAIEWNGLATTLQITTAPDIFSYAMTGAGQRFRLIDAYNYTAQVQMRYMGTENINRRFLLGDVSTGDALFFNYNGVDSNLDTMVDIWPIPNDEQLLYFNLIIPQPRFSADSTVLKVPSQPVILGAYWKAVVERGEDGGANAADAERNYREALANAIALDQGHFPEESIWVAT